MHTTLLSCVLCLTLFNLMVDGSRTPKQGHLMLSGISLESAEFERQTIIVANQIEQLQTADDGPASQLVQRYILPVFLYVHAANRICHRPIYLALDVQPSGPDAKQFLNYLQIVEIYDETYYQPIIQTSSLTPFTYPNKIQPFNPTNELDRHYVIAGLRDPKIRQEVITRLSLVFVESIRFYSVRRAVQQALNMKGAVDFAPHMPLIRQWEAMTNDLVHLLTMNRNGIEVDQKLPVTSSNQNVYSVSVFHLNAAAQVNMWFLYQFIRCNNQYHQQTQDGDGSCDVDTWSQTKWKVGCENANDRDVPTGNLNLESCVQMCQRTPTCSHFSWKNNDCYLKSGQVVATEEKQTYDLRHTCGYKKTSGKDDSLEFAVELDSAFDAADDALHVSASNAADCYHQCHKNASCKTFTWHEEETSGGDCYLQSSVSNTKHQAAGHISGHRLGRNIIRNRLNRFRRGHVIAGPTGSGTLKVIGNSGPDLYVSNRYGWSAHNCHHNVRKTGVIFYPTNTKYKNVVLLVCESCFGYKSSNSGTQHQQLHNWYYSLYGESKSFSLVSGFSEKDDKTLGFNSWSMNAAGPYTDNSNTMGSFEQNVVQKVVSGRLDDYVA